MESIYQGYFETRDGKFWIFTYDYERHTSEITQGDKEYTASQIFLKEVEVEPAVAVWLQACFQAATGRIYYSSAGELAR